MEPAVSLILSPLRADLEANEQTRGDGAAEMVVRDPVNGNIYSFPPKAFAILAAITLGQTIDELIGPISDEATARRHQQVQALLYKAAGMGLFVVAGANPVPAPPPPPKSWRQKLVAKITNPVWHLYEIPLHKVEPAVKVLAALLFSRAAWLVLALFVLAVGCLAHGFSNYVGTIQILDGFIWWWAVLPMIILSSFWHEIGHYAAAVKAGHKVTRGGFAIVVIYPSLYVNVDDYFMVRKRRDRLFIALGGVYFDSIVFSASTLAWYFSLPFSVLNQISYIISLAALVRIATNLVPFFKADGNRAFEEVVGIRHARMESLGVWRNILRLRASKVKHVSRAGVALLAVYGLADLAFMVLSARMAQHFIGLNAAGLSIPYAGAVGALFGLLIALSFVLGVRRDLKRKSLQTQGA